MANILTASIVITSVALVLAQYMEAHSTNIFDESKKKLGRIKEQLGGIGEAVKSDAEAYNKQYQWMTGEWDALNSAETSATLGFPIRALLFIIFAAFVLLHPGVSMAGDYLKFAKPTIDHAIEGQHDQTTQGSNENQHADGNLMITVDRFLDAYLPTVLLILQLVLVVAVFWLGGSLWRIVWAAGKYAKRVSVLEETVRPYSIMVPGTATEEQAAGKTVAPNPILQDRT